MVRRQMKIALSGVQPLGAFEVHDAALAAYFQGTLMNLVVMVVAVTEMLVVEVADDAVEAEIAEVAYEVVAAAEVVVVVDLEAAYDFVDVADDRNGLLLGQGMVVDQHPCASLVWSVDVAFGL